MTTGSPGSPRSRAANRWWTCTNGACFFDASTISREARTNRALLADVLTAAGLVNYPTEWWHWSFGDRYWAFSEQQAHAIYGPVERPVLSTASH